MIRSNCSGPVNVETMNRTIILILSSFLVLAVSFRWADLFLFSKSVKLPDWASGLDNPLCASQILVFMCLLPVSFLFPTPKKASFALLKASIVGATGPLIFFCSNNHLNDPNTILVNAGMQYIWILLGSYAVPVVILSLSRLAINYLFLGRFGAEMDQNQAEFLLLAIVVGLGPAFMSLFIQLFIDYFTFINLVLNTPDYLTYMIGSIPSTLLGLLIYLSPVWFSKSTNA